MAPSWHQNRTDLALNPNANMNLCDIAFSLGYTCPPASDSTVVCFSAENKNTGESETKYFKHSDDEATIIADSQNIAGKISTGKIKLIVNEAVASSDCIQAINAKSDDGQTLLIKAAKNGRKDIIELLLRYNADVNAKVRFTKADLDKDFNCLGF